MTPEASLDFLGLLYLLPVSSEKAAFNIVASPLSLDYPRRLVASLLVLQVEGLVFFVDDGHFFESNPLSKLATRFLLFSLSLELLASAGSLGSPDFF